MATSIAISALPAATAPALADVFPIVQSGVTKKVAFSTIFPASSTDNAIVRWDGTTGLKIQNSLVTLNDAGQIIGVPGAVGAPSYAYSGDATSGSWLIGAGFVGYSAGGVEYLRMGNYGNLARTNVFVEAGTPVAPPPFKDGIRLYGDTGASTNYMHSVSTNLGGAYANYVPLEIVGSTITLRGASGTTRNTGISIATDGTVTQSKTTFNSSVVVGTGALATNATTGFLYQPTCAGTPVGTPTSQTGTLPIVYDTTNNIPYGYNGSWRSLAGAVLISQTSPTGTDTVTFSSIPAVFKHLIITGVAQLTGGAGSIQLTINSDTGSNYDYNILSMVNTSVSGSTSLAIAASAATIANVPGTSNTSPGTFMSVLENYANTSFDKTVFSTCWQTARAAASSLIVNRTLNWRNTAAITTLSLVGSSNYQTGTNICLYGVP